LGAISAGHIRYGVLIAEQLRWGGHSSKRWLFVLPRGLRSQNSVL